LGWVLRVLGILILGIAIAYVALETWATKQLTRAYEALARDGRPFHADQILPAQVPIEENASLLYQAASLVLRAQPGDASLLASLPSDLRWGPQLERLKVDGDLYYQLRGVAGALLRESTNIQLQEAQRTLARHPAVLQALDMVERGARREHCQFELGPVGLLSVNYLDLQSLTKILAATSRIRALDGQEAKAWQLARLSLRVANALEEDHLLLGQLVRIGQARNALNTVQWLCDIYPPTPETADSLIGEITPFEDIHPLVRSFDGERLYCTEQMFRSPETSPELIGENPDIPARLVHAGLAFYPLWRAEHAAYLNLIREEVEMALLPYDPSVIAQSPLERIPFYCVLAKIMAPNLISARIGCLSTVAEARITRAGLGVIKYWEKQGSVPETLEAAGVEDILDPFTNAPLVYEPLPVGFMISSLGPSQGGRYPEAECYGHYRPSSWRWQVPRQN
jgi:hypothetical protein